MSPLLIAAEEIRNSIKNNLNDPAPVDIAERTNAVIKEFLKTHPKAVGVDTVDVGSMNRSTCMHTKLMSIQLVISIIIVTLKQEECDKEKAG